MGPIDFNNIGIAGNVPDAQDPAPITQEPFAATVETRIEDAPNIKQLMPSSANFANREKYPDQFNFCKSELWGIVDRIKSRRAALEDEWLSTQRLRTLTHDGGQKYRGRSNVYMPTYSTAHNTIVSQLARGLFPSDEYMDVYAKDIKQEEAATVIKDRIRYEFDCKANVRTQIKPAVGQLVDHGNGVLKYWYRTGTEFVGKKAKSGFQFQKKEQQGLTVSARSIFNVLVYPETASDEKEVQITAEYITMNRNYALQLGKTQRWENIDEALAMARNVSNRDQYTRDQTLIDTARVQGLTTSVDYSADDKAVVQQITGVEVWCSMRLPKEAYVDGEDSTLPVPARVMMFQGTPVSITRNPHFDQKHPYLWGRVNVTPGSFYGSWCGRKSKSLQYMINDLANQTNDCGIYALNPFLVVDTNLMSGPILPVAPGRIYRTRNIKDALRFEHPPAELIQYGSNLLSLYIGALMDNSGAPPVLQGIGKSSETATGQSILQRNSLQPLQDSIEDLEAQWMNPLMERGWRLLVQYSDETIELPPEGPNMPPRQMSLADLDQFEYDFKFLASSQLANQQARAQQAIMLLQTMTPPMIQLLQSNGMMVNPTPVLKRLHTDLGLRQFNEFVYPIQQNPIAMQQMQMQQAQQHAELASSQQAGQPSGPQASAQPMGPPGPENNAPIPGGQETEPQATDDFSVTRSIADEIAAMAGRAGGAPQ